MEYNEARAIDEAEILILKLCKSAVEMRYDKLRFKREVDRIIDDVCESLHSEELKKKARNSLRLYSQRCYAKEYRIFRDTAAFYAILLIGVGQGRAEAIRQKKSFDFTSSKELRHSPGFLDMLDKQLSDTAYPSRLPLNEYHKRYMQRVEKLTKELSESSAKEDYTTNVSLRNIAEMTVRYEHQLDMINEKRESGRKLVYILAHANCSKRCQKYQVGGTKHPSGLYSLDGTSGVTEGGIKYVPLEFATHNPEDLYTTKAGVTYQNGCLTGFNCRHILGDYIPGVKPETIPTDVIERRRSIEQKQREYERDIRKYRKSSVVLQDINPRLASKYSEIAREKEKEYRSFSRQNGVAFYPERLKVLSDETNGLTKSNIDDIINSFEVTDAQFGKKLGKHASDYDLDPSCKADRDRFQSLINNIVKNADEVRIGYWRGQPKDVIFLIKNNDVVIIKQNSEFVSILKGGVNNPRVKNAGNKKV